MSSELYEHLGVNKTAMEWLNYWISERERIRIVKETGPFNLYKGDSPPPKPWSTDPIFQTTYFCNVRREDDKVTKWIRQNWTPEAIGWEQYDYSMVLARFLNRPETLLEIYGCFDKPNDIERILEMMAAAGEQVWGGAYLVSTHGLPMGKAAYLCQRVLPHAYEALAAPGQQSRYTSSPLLLAHHHAALMQLEGLGSFMAAQVIADLKNTVGHPLSKAEDWCGWSAPGPGSLRGLSWIFEKSGPGSYSSQMKQVRLLLTDENYQLLKGTHDAPNMQDLQNCLCEFDKFMRVMTKTGKSKRKYNGK